MSTRAMVRGSRRPCRLVVADGSVGGYPRAVRCSLAEGLLVELPRRRYRPAPDRCARRRCSRRERCDRVADDGVRRRGRELAQTCRCGPTAGSRPLPRESSLARTLAGDGEASGGLWLLQYAVQPAGLEGAQELAPEGLGLGLTHGQADGLPPSRL